MALTEFEKSFPTDFLIIAALPFQADALRYL
jgi:hypothetical protein